MDRHEYVDVFEELKLVYYGMIQDCGNWTIDDYKDATLLVKGIGITPLLF